MISFPAPRLRELSLENFNFWARCIWPNAYIQSGDLLIVDKSLEATHGKIVIAAIDGELTVKRLSCLTNRVQLLPENEGYPAIDITNEQELVIWGVVTHVIHQAG